MAPNDEDRSEHDAAVAKSADGEAVLAQTAPDLDHMPSVGLKPHAHAAGHAGVLAALGIVFGDIGTSPIYTLDTAFKSGVIHPVPDDVLGFLSLIVWSLFVVVGIWYAVFIMRADNRGEGGIFALMALAAKSVPRFAGFIAVAGIIGASLFYGDAVITPAISVLSAVEGLEVIAPALEEVVLPMAIVILTTLFAVQRGGASKVGGWFGPIILVWFAVLAVVGIKEIAFYPQVLYALDPRAGIEFLIGTGPAGFAVMAVVVLAVTGGEALYADMGHVGRDATRKAFAFVVAPALVLNYLGQGAWALGRAAGGFDVENPFFHLVSAHFAVPLVLLATVATVIASQAVISGAFTLTHQAAHLGFWPRTDTRHTSAEERGQVYVHSINLLLFVGVIAIVLIFQKSEKLAEAYGFAVTGTMVVTTILAYIVARGVWGWSRLQAIPLVGCFMVIVLAFFVSCATKILHGAWLPLVIGALLIFVMSAWRMGRLRLAARRRHEGVPIKIALSALRSPRIEHVRGTAIYLMEDPSLAPRSFLHNLKHNKCAHQQIVFLYIQTTDEPWVDNATRASVDQLGDGLAMVKVRFGFMETPDVPSAVKATEAMGVYVDKKDLSFFVSRAHLVEGDEGGIWTWLRGLFIFLYRNQADPAEYYQIPPGRVIDLGAQITI
ncbi:potassium transporter Kup [Siculibacillus lacustris]|uniref:Probable potassium transport system protein Kup n=1 Tax=Siculibacillus lacustris TaxID=1549641 RepID=A0A4Q9VX96_9HYPH|nr:KUP/HAK/KT family potassium transporter [Siculibacillus lacustris]TBW40901.1 potassium transporter Kup [Siculibacillus lacustris]